MRKVSHPSRFCTIKEGNKGCVTPVALPFTLKSIEDQRRIMEIISPCKNIIFEKVL
jgi:hypothetical protein